MYRRQKHNPKNRLGFCRQLMILCGIAILLWSGLEDNNANAVSVLAAATATVATLYILASRLGGRALHPADHLRLSVLAGFLAGSSACLLAASLMLFKDLRHAHIYPDYPPQMILAMLERLPHWTLAGGLAGIGIGLLLKLKAEWHRQI